MLFFSDHIVFTSHASISADRGISNDELSWLVDWLGDVSNSLIAFYVLFFISIQLLYRWLVLNWHVIKKLCIQINTVNKHGLRDLTSRGVARLFKMRGRQGGGAHEWAGGDWDSKWQLSMIDLCTKCNFILRARGGQSFCQGCDRLCHPSGYATANILNIVKPFRTTPVIIQNKSLVFLWNPWNNRDNLNKGFMLAQNTQNHFRLTANHIFVEISLYRWRQIS